MVSEAVKQSAKRTYLKHRGEAHARRILFLAIQNGKMTRRPCEICGDTTTEAHHDDYNKPLEVRWLCQKHHKEWHKYNEPIRPTQKRTCPICGKTFKFNNKHRKFCSDACRSERIKQINREVGAKREARDKIIRAQKAKERIYICKTCGKNFHPDHALCKYCSKECFKESRLEQKREEYQRNKEKYRKYQKEIAKKNGVSEKTIRRRVWEFKPEPITTLKLGRKRKYFYYDKSRNKYRVEASEIYPGKQFDKEQEAKEYIESFYTGGGFAAYPELAKIVGAKGGRISRRGPAGTRKKEKEYIWRPGDAMFSK